MSNLKFQLENNSFMTTKYGCPSVKPTGRLPEPRLVTKYGCPSVKPSDRLPDSRLVTRYACPSVKHTGRFPDSKLVTRYACPVVRPKDSKRKNPFGRYGSPALDLSEER